jgi:hypothetical protein
MKDSRRFKIFITLTLVILIAITVSVYYILNAKKGEDYSTDVLGEEVISGVPYIVTLPPVSGYEGRVYEYVISVIDSDSKDSELEVEYLEGPSWLELDARILRGVPPFGSSGTYKIVLRVSDGYNTSSQESYILIEENE